MLYNPDFTVTGKVLSSWVDQVNLIFVVDNYLSDHTEELS